MDKLILGSYKISPKSKVVRKENRTATAYKSGGKRTWAKIFEVILIFASLMVSATHVFAQSDPTLSNLTISPGSLNETFVSTTTSYTANVTYSTLNITVTPTTTDPNASVTVNGTTVPSGNPSGNISLSVGTNTITVIGTSQDLSATDTYTITVTRAAPSTDASLSNLTTSAGGLTPGFTSGNLTYAASVSNVTTSITVTPTTTDVNASVTVNGSPATSG
ncbi:MAG: cadherin-like beta sandwich domain-containing protein, partial [Bacteroidetes bacterium]|nr:cadherin-like beta sandwich domain-containing protein [Bacteroidota bacterium]